MDRISAAKDIPVPHKRDATKSYQLKQHDQFVGPAGARPVFRKLGGQKLLLQPLDPFPTVSPKIQDAAPASDFVHFTYDQYR